jgi:hypothetical protein
MLQSSFEFREEQQFMFFLDDWKALARAFSARTTRRDDRLRQQH